MSGVHLLILHFKCQFSKSIKSSTFHIFLTLTCLSRANFSLISLTKFDRLFVWRSRTSWAICLAIAGRVAIAEGSTFLYRQFVSLTRDNSRRVSKAEICIKEVKMNSAKHTVIEWSRETQTMRDILNIWLFNEVMNNHAGSNSTWPVGKPLSSINAR